MCRARLLAKRLHKQQRAQICSALAAVRKSVDVSNSASLPRRSSSDPVSVSMLRVRVPAFLMQHSPRSDRWRGGLTLAVQGREWFYASTSRSQSGAELHTATLARVRFCPTHSFVRAVCEAWSMLHKTCERHMRRAACLDVADLIAGVGVAQQAREPQERFPRAA